MNHHLKADLAAIVSGFGAISAWQEQFGWAIQVLGALVALVAGGLSLYQRLKKPPEPKSLD
jgi:uncharacterized membrane protein HdeD (DUF308 family)